MHWFPSSQVTTSQSDGGNSVSVDDSSGSESKQGSQAKRIKRKKNKDKDVDEQGKALDPVRYKTKMCKNWSQQSKCPYGPRCLFAHGPKEMRTYNGNQTAISSAGTSTYVAQIVIIRICLCASHAAPGNLGTATLPRLLPCRQQRQYECACAPFDCLFIFSLTPAISSAGPLSDNSMPSDISPRLCPLRSK